MPARLPADNDTADVAQLVEHHLAKVDVASSNLVVRSRIKKAAPRSCFFYARILRISNSLMEVTDTPQKKSLYLM